MDTFKAVCQVWLRPFKRLARLATPDIVQVRCPRCMKLVDAFSHHDCPQVAIIVVMRTKRRVRR